jgi:hypothetical protein
VSTDVLAVMREHGVTLDDIAEAAGFSAYSCRKYVYGEREIRSKGEIELVNAHGVSGKIVIAAMREKRAEYLATHPLAPTNGRHGKRIAMPKTRAKPRPKQSDPWKPISRAADDDWDGVLYSIEEWKRLFGAPGSSQGVSGRVEGFFTTEPCFIGE